MDLQPGLRHSRLHKGFKTANFKTITDTDQPPETTGGFMKWLKLWRRERICWRIRSTCQESYYALNWKWGLPFDIDKLNEQIAELEKQTAQAGFWDDHQSANRILKQIKNLQEEVDRYQTFMGEACYINDMLEMADNEGDEQLFHEVAGELEDLWARFQDYQLLIWFSGEHDKSDGIVSLHAGQGGTEAQDWGGNALADVIPAGLKPAVIRCSYWIAARDAAGIKA